MFMYLNNRIEQDHRGIKQRYGPTLGFKSFDCAAIFCSAVDETRHRTTMKENISLAQGLDHFLQSVTVFQQLTHGLPGCLCQTQGKSGGVNAEPK
jgi:hypothetical protein